VFSGCKGEPGVYVLIISGRRPFSELCLHALGRYGIEGEVISDAQKAPFALQERTYHAVVWDPKGHRSSKSAFVDLLKNIQPNLKIIIIGDAAFGPQCGEDAYLEMPFNPSVLALMIRELCRGNAEQEIRASQSEPLFSPGRRILIHPAEDFRTAIQAQILFELEDLFAAEVIDSSSVNLTPGRSVTIMVKAWDGVYLFESTVLYVRGNNLRFAKPALISRSQMRAHPRYVPRHKVELILEGYPDLPRIQVVNYSAGGMMLASPVPFERGSLLRYSILQENDIPSRGEVQVVWCNPEQGNGGYKVGVKYPKPVDPI